MTSGFEILPAIDLRGGRVVRLRQGDFRREMVYSDDPVAVAVGFVDAGARWLHVVDLDGASTGTPAHAQLIRKLVHTIGVRAAVEVAGGLRTANEIAAVMDAGAARVVLGTAALHDAAFAKAAAESVGADRVVVALDVTKGFAIGNGWKPEAPGVPACDAMRALADVGITTFQATAINRDGLLGGPDLDLLERLIAVGRGHVIAAGGIRSLEDIRVVRDIGCVGVILGTALYEGRIGASDAFELAD